MGSLGIGYQCSGSKPRIAPLILYDNGAIQIYLLTYLLMGLPGRERSLTIFSAVWIEHTNGQTDTGRQQKDRAYA